MQILKFNERNKRRNKLSSGTWRFKVITISHHITVMSPRGSLKFVYMCREHVVRVRLVCTVYSLYTLTAQASLSTSN